MTVSNHTQAEISLDEIVQELRAFNREITGIVRIPDPSWPDAKCGECGWMGECAYNGKYFICRRTPWASIITNEHIYEIMGSHIGMADQACPAFVRRPVEDGDDNE